ncbi:M1 family metallopeptidase [Fodinibius sp.]|uniref:M1 family metallopeptidase n=1 Tax=Fodinibius sp. TaxID=1872440 RepID=UPI003567F23A
MSLFPNLSKTASLLLFAAVLTFTGCAGSQQARTNEQQAPGSEEKQFADGPLSTNPSELNRMVPNAITGEIPQTFFQAINRDTRTMSGEPGSDYWQQWTDYNIDVELVPADTLIKGSSTITYHNNSPDTLNQLFMELTQNVHQSGAVRNQGAEVTGGVNLHRVAAGDTDLEEMQSGRSRQGYLVDGTLMVLRPGTVLAPGDSIEIQVAWDFKIPQQGASGRMGYSEDNLFYIAYWYPQMRVYDDVNGWFTDPFKGNAEFYHGFADYNVDITAPEQWMVASTGDLTNAGDVLKDDIYRRLQEGHSSDEVVPVVTKEDFGDVTRSTGSGTVTWNFTADKVRDFAFSATKESMWDATRSDVGDRDGDGETDYVEINAIYRSSAPLWTDAAAFTRHSLSSLSETTGISYPWPHMTSVEGGGIIGGGMEFPMMTIIGDYSGRPAQSLYAVIAHELAHMWVPMQISTNERRYAWMDEGTTTFNESQSKKEYYPESAETFEQSDYQSYLQITGTGLEGPIMRWSDYHYNGFAYGIASYPKPASMLVALRGLLGEETFRKAYQTFLSRWQYKHPYPWDMFNAFEDVSGRELDWFWRSWYYETWTLDQAVGGVRPVEGGTEIVIEDRGQAPMPAPVEITLSDGTTLTREIPVETWLKGTTRATLSIDHTGEVTNVVVDPERKFPDANRTNNSWEK